MVLGGGRRAAYPETMALSPVVTLRPATAADAPMLAARDREPHVIACSSDDPEAEVAFGSDWADEVTHSAYELTYLMAEVEGQPVGVMAVCDPHTEPSHYWGDIEPGLRAVDIWIGPAEWLGRGVGTQMMTQMIDRCFAEPEVTAIVIDPLNSNTAAHRFYRRLGFAVVGRRLFDEDDCLVMRLDRGDWQRASALVIPAEAQRRAGTAGSGQISGPASEPGQSQSVPGLADASPGWPQAGRPGEVIGSGDRPGSPLRSGRDDKARNA